MDSYFILAFVIGTALAVGVAKLLFFIGELND